jgi:hypothetical protein
VFRGAASHPATAVDAEEVPRSRDPLSSRVGTVHPCYLANPRFKDRTVRADDTARPGAIDHARRMRSSGLGHRIRAVYRS